MEQQSQLLVLDLPDWRAAACEPDWIRALEAGKVLYFPHLPFELRSGERRFFDPALLAPGVRNISLDKAGEGGAGRLKGVAGEPVLQRDLAAMIGRFRAQARQLIDSLLPHYSLALRMAPTSFRPARVETRAQSWRADDRRLHIDAFPSRPNHGERILRVFANVNPEGAARVWRVGEPFEDMARRFLPRVGRYFGWQASLLRALHITKAKRSEYDHLMLRLHDAMKSDAQYQDSAPQQTVLFAAGSVWICFSDQTAHAVTSGQYMMEQTLHLPPARQYDPTSSPLAILQRLTGRRLV